MRFRILHYKTVCSTNDVARELAEWGAPEGTVVESDYQTKGRGRGKNKWRSTRGKNLLFSVILRPTGVRVNQISMITQVAAVSVRNVLKQKYGLNGRIKRPNDVLVDGKKICGVLVEGSSSLHQVHYLVVGIGLNVNWAKRELLRGSTSIRAVVGRSLDREEVLESVLKGLRKEYHDYVSNNGFS